MKRIIEQDEALEILNQTVWYPKCKDEVLSVISDLRVNNPDLEQGLNLLLTPSMPSRKLNLAQHALLMMHELSWSRTIYWIAYERMPTINPKQSPLNKPKYKVNRLKAKSLSSMLDLWKGCSEFFNLPYSPYEGWTKSVQEAKQAQIESIYKLNSRP